MVKVQQNSQFFHLNLSALGVQLKTSFARPPEFDWIGTAIKNEFASKTYVIFKKKVRHLELYRREGTSGRLQNIVAVSTTPNLTVSLRGRF